MKRKQMKSRSSRLFKLAAIVVCLLMMIGMTACGSSDDADTQDSSQPAASETQPAASETQPAADESADAAAETAEDTGGASEDPEAVDPSAPKEIGEEAALDIALKDAGLSRDDLSYTNVQLDTDDGVTKYEVEFKQGNMEYDYDIEAYTGDILEKDSEQDDD